MPLLRPNFDLEDFRNFEQDYIPLETSEKIEGVLKKAGLPEKHFKEEIPNDLSQQVNPAEDILKRTLNHSGASVENASRVISHVMHRGKYENSRLKAAELVLDLHGIRDKEGKINKQPIFQFFVKDSAINLQNVFAPIRDENIIEPPRIDFMNQNPEKINPELDVPEEDEEIDFDEIDEEDDLEDEDVEKER